MPKTMKPIVFIAVSGLLACQSEQANTEQAPLSPPKQNTAPTFCTMQYDPVCATIKTNGETRQKTFSNRCVLGNATAQVINVTEGECGK